MQRAPTDKGYSVSYKLDMTNVHREHPLFRLIFYYVPWLSTAVVIIALSHQPADTLPHVENPLIDKLAHVIEYFILAVCTLRVFGIWIKSPASSKQWSVGLLSLSVLAFVFVFGLADEYHQRFIDGRVFDLVDLSMDLAGGVLVIIFHLLARKSKLNLFLR